MRGSGPDFAELARTAAEAAGTRLVAEAGQMVYQPDVDLAAGSADSLSALSVAGWALQSTRMACVSATSWCAVAAKGCAFENHLVDQVQRHDGARSKGAHLFPVPE